MLVVQCEDRLAKARAWAEKVGLTDQLQGQLDYLEGYSDRETRCQLYTDFAPHSFGFTMEVKRDGEWVRWFNGGLIYHGPHDNGGDGGAPTFSVNITPTNGWSVHT